MLLHKIYYFTARQIEFVSFLSFYCFRWFHIWYDAAKDGWCARNPFKQFGISFYAQISNDFYVQQMLLLPLCSSDQQIAEYPHILFYSIVAIVCAGHVLERSLAVCVASIPHTPVIIVDCVILLQKHLSLFMSCEQSSHFILCACVSGWLRIKSQSTAKQSKSLAGVREHEDANENGRTAYAFLSPHRS